jgi:vacuolar-type H+-ATPase subunit E/Vma4
MQTVKSSEALEAQILEDARAKARRITEAAKKECAEIRAAAERRDQEEVRRMESGRESRLAALRSDLEASIPLELKRLRLDFYQDRVQAALKELFESLEPRERGRIIGGMVAKASFAFTNQNVVVRCSLLPPEEARRIVTANVAGAQVREAESLPPDEAAEAGPGLFVETADGSRRFRATLGELTALLLEEHREELVKALFGADVQA